MKALKVSTARNINFGKRVARNGSPPSIMKNSTSIATTGLPKDWAYSPSIDLELKQYTLLGYLQRVKARFGERKLYPYLEHLHEHLGTLLELQRAKEDLARTMVGSLVGFDPHTGNAIHERPKNGAWLDVIDEVIEFAVPGLKNLRSQGLDIEQEIAQHIRFTPIGLQPLHISEGWIFLRHGKEARVYGYAVPILQDTITEHVHRNVSTRYVSSYTVGIGSGFEHIKADLIQRFPAQPVPATFALETDLAIPCIETFMPLAKRLVLAHVRGNS